MYFSIVVGYRNREVDRVSNFLHSLKSQESKNFEVIFLDYGSDEVYKQQIEHLCASFPFVTYRYNETRGFFWNRSHALNSGVSFAKGDILVFADIDMIYPPKFISELSKRVKSNKVYHYRCHFLPRSYNTELAKLANNFNVVINSDSKKLYGYPKSGNQGLGLGIYPKGIFEKIAGYNEFYRIYGVEDLDIHEKVKRLNIEIEWLDYNNDLVAFHQWHPRSLSSLPTGWYSMMLDKFKKGRNQDSKTENGKFYTIDDRPALKLYLKGECNKQKQINIDFPLANTYFRIIDSLIYETDSEYYVINFKSKFTTPGSKGKLSRLVTKINDLLNRTSFSYRITDIKNSSEFISNKELSDFLFYLFINMSSLIEDFYIEVTDNTTYCIIKRSRRTTDKCDLINNKELISHITF